MKSKSQRIAAIKPFIQFCLVGGSGVLVDMTVLFLLVDPCMLGLPLVWSKLAAAEMAMINNFIWNDCWTFREFSILDSSWRGRVYRFLKFNVVCSAGLCIGVALLHVQAVRFGVNLYTANILAITAATFWNYGVNRRLNWRLAPLKGPSI